MEIMHVADGGGADWEAELNRLASMETETELPYAQAISDALLDISNVLRGVTADGIEGDTGDAARAAFNSDANDATQLSADVTQLIANLRAMNDDRRAVAHEHLDALNNYPEALNSDDEYQLCTAETGSTWQLGPLTFTITDGIIGALNTYFRAQRQARAQEGVKAVADRMDYWAQQFNTQTRLAPTGNQGTDSTRVDAGGGNFAGDTGPTTGGGDGSFGLYPGGGHNPAGYVPPGITYTPPRDPGTGDETGPTVPTFPITSLPDRPDDEINVGWPVPTYPIVPPDDVHSWPALPDYPPRPWNPDDPTGNNPDAPWTPVDPGSWEPTGPTYPDDDLYTPYVPGENSGSDYQPYTPHPPYHPATSNPTGSYIPGTDGGQYRTGLTPDSAMGNGSHGWGTGTSVGRATGLGVGSTSGLLSSGGTGIGGTSAGTGGGIGGAGSAGLIGGAGGAVSLAGAKLMQTGLNGSHGASALATAPGTAAAGARSGGGMGMMGGGAGGGQSTGSKSRRGLSGLVAPHLDDDDEPLPRSEAAGAGGRD